MFQGKRLARRDVLRWAGLGGGTLVLGGLLQACAPSAPPSAPTQAASPAPAAAATPASVPQQAPASTGPTAVAENAPPQPLADWQQQWDTLVAAAKQEGTVTVIVPPGDVYRAFADVFQTKYGIQVQLIVGNGNADIVPKVQDERTAGQYVEDVIAHSPGAQFAGLVPIGAQDPLVPALILPEVLDDAKWLHSFQSGWADLAQTMTYDFAGFAQPTVRINRAVVPESALSTLDDLWDPAWKGKVALFDPRIGGAGQQAISVWLLTLGADRLRDFLQNQQPALTQDRRQLGEWLVRGEYPMGIGVAPDSLSPFSTQGVDVSQIVALDPTNPNGVYLAHGTGAVGLMNKAPHPNAAKVFVNWLLTQEGQVAWSSQAGNDSRRLDVPPVDPSSAPDPNIEYVSLDIERTYPLRDQAVTIAKETLQ